MLLMCHRTFVIYRGNESMQISKSLTIYYFLAVQCKLDVFSKYYSSENVHQNVRLLNVLRLNTFSLHKQRRTAGLLRVLQCKTMLRHTLSRHGLE